MKDGGIRNGQFGSNINTANVIAAMFIATGQDPASTAEASWTHLTSELDPVTRDLKMSLYIPSLPVGTVGGGTGYNIEAMQAYVDVPTFFSKVYLVDLSPSLLKVARSRFDRLGWDVCIVCTDARTFRLEDYKDRHDFQKDGNA